MRNASLTLHGVVSVETEVSRHPNGVESSPDPYIAVTLTVTTSDGSEMRVILFSKHGSMEIEGMPK